MDKSKETIDLTPSWPAVLGMMLAVLDNKKASTEGRFAALKTLEQMANVAQLHLELQKKIEKINNGKLMTNDEIVFHLGAGGFGVGSKS